MSKYTQIPVNLAKTLQTGAGMLVDSFNVATGAYGNILGATSNGLTINVQPQYIDLGEDIDGVKNNTADLKMIDYTQVSVSGTLVSNSQETMPKIFPHATISGSSSRNGVLVKITPKDIITLSQYSTIWWVGDYTSVTTGADAGFLAIKMSNVLNTAGLSFKTNDKNKGQYSFEFTAHYSLNDIDTVPVEIYAFTAEQQVTVTPSELTINVGDVVSLTAVSTPASAVKTWSSDDDEVVSVAAGGVITGVAEGTATVSASITVLGSTYTSSCEVTVVDE